MKKLCFLVLVGLLFSGCATSAKESEFWKHDAMYKNCDHLKFSLYGYKHPTAETLKKSQEQGWWGIPIRESSEK